MPRRVDAERKESQRKEKAEVSAGAKTQQQKPANRWALIRAIMKHPPTPVSPEPCSHSIRHNQVSTNTQTVVRLHNYSIE